MPAVLPEVPRADTSRDEPIQGPTRSREVVLNTFHESVATIAGLLGDMCTPLRRCPYNRDRFLVEDAFSCMWKDSKQLLGRGDDEAAKVILRTQGASTPFMDALYTLLRVETGSSPRLSEEQAKRFSVALRFAVHLSSDGGELIHKELDRALHPSRSSCPLAIINAYLAYKVRKAQ